MALQFMAYLEECRIYIKPNQTVKQVFSLKTEVIWLPHSNEEDLNFSAAEDTALTLPIANCCMFRKQANKIKVC